MVGVGAYLTYIFITNKVFVRFLINFVYFTRNELKEALMPGLVKPARIPMGIAKSMGPAFVMVTFKLVWLCTNQL